MLSDLLHRREFITAGAATIALTAAPCLAAGRASPNMAAVIDDFARASAFNGVVLIGAKGKPIYERTFGYADIEEKRPTRIDDAYGIASISKWLTTLAVLRLSERGALQLDAPIIRWLPAYRQDTGSRITLRHLLWNSSGLTEQFSPQSKADPTLLKSDVPTTEAVRRFASGDLVFAPGERFDYIFASWILVLAIVEAVTGQPFASAMQRLVFEPLGLSHTNTGMADADSVAPIPSYSAIPVQRRSYDRPPFLAAAGGCVSTAGDLLRAAHPVFDTGFLLATSRATLLSKRSAADEYALGGRVRMLSLAGGSRTFAWETGNTAGYRALLAHRLDTQQTVVILNNTSLAQRILDDFAAAIFAVM